MSTRDGVGMHGLMRLLRNRSQSLLRGCLPRRVCSLLVLLPRLCVRLKLFGDGMVQLRSLGLLSLFLCCYLLVFCALVGEAAFVALPPVPGAVDFSCL